VPNAVPQPLPPNNSPAAIFVGVIISLFAVAASVAWLRLYLVPPAMVTLPRTSETAS
jgi:hypothetical protein